jgi:hypothetical protein
VRSLVRVQNGPLENFLVKPKGKAKKNSGDIAQLVERLLCTQEVRSSNLLISTKLLSKDDQRKQKQEFSNSSGQRLERLLNSSESKNLERTLKTA